MGSSRRWRAATTSARSALGGHAHRFGGPCPPRGHGRLRYRLRLHAVAEDLRLAPGAGVRDLELALASKVLAVAELVGAYGR